MTVVFGVLSGRLVTDLYHAQVKSAARPTTRQRQPEHLILKNDPYCGIPAGGTNCDLDCERLGGVFKDPGCLSDCLTPSCLTLLMADYERHNGVCNGSLGHIQYNWPASNGCVMGGGVQVVEGLCSNNTIQALIQQTCINEIFSLPFHLSVTITSLVRSLCRHEVHDYFTPRSIPACGGLDCVRTMTSEGLVVLEDYSCRSDCSCTELLSSDHFHSGGICANTYTGYQLDWPVSSQPCQTDGVIVLEGFCTNDTIQALIQPKCINEVWASPEETRDSLLYLIGSICRHEVSDYFFPRSCGLDCVTTMTNEGLLLYEDSSCLSDCGCINFYDGNGNGGGFCAGTKRITSPSFPNNYPTYTTVYYNMSAPGRYVDIEFSMFDIEYDATCRDDWVMILDSDGEMLLRKGFMSFFPDKFMTESRLIPPSSDFLKSLPGCKKP